MTSYPPPKHIFSIFNKDEYLEEFTKDWVESNFYKDGFPYIETRRVILSQNSNDTNEAMATSLYNAVEKAKLLSPTFENPVTIDIYPGSYYESQAIIVDVDLIKFNCISAYFMCNFYLDTDLGVGSAWITIDSQACECIGIGLNAQGNCDYVIRVNSNSQNSGLDWYYFWVQNGRVANIYMDGGLMYINQGLITADIDSIGVLMENGAYSVPQICTIFTTDPYTNITAWSIKSGSYLQLMHDIADSGTIFLECDGAVAQINNGIVRNFETVFSLTNGGKVYSKNVFFETNTIHNNQYDNTCLYISSSDNIDIENLDLTTMDSSNTTLSFFSESRNNFRGNKILGNLSVGSTHFPSPAYFGNGSSDLTDTITMTFDGSVYNIVNLKEDVAVPTSLFQGTSTSNIFYTGDNSKFSAVLYNLSTFLTGGAVVLEYYNGVAWVSLNYMVIFNNYPYYSNGNTLFSLSEEIHFFDNTILRGTNWQQTTINGFLKYWIRYRITSAITTAPICSSIKNFFNSTHIRSTGIVFNYGLARSLKLLPFDLGLTADVGTAVTDTDLYFSTKIMVGRINNNFATNRFTTGILYCPSDIDTSSPIILKICFISSATTINQANFAPSIDVANLTEGTRVYTTAQAGVVLPTESTINYSIQPNQTNGQFCKYADLPFYLPQLKPSDVSGNVNQLICFRFGRPSTDTANANGLILLQLGFYYTSYKLSNISQV